MALVEVNWNPDRKQLRGFGWICLVAFGAIGAWLYFRHSFLVFDFAESTAQRAAYVLWAVGGVSAALAAVAPMALKPLFVGLTLVSLPIGFVVSHIIMGLLFYGVITPIGLVFRVLGKDLLHRKLEPERGSYWEARKPVTDVSRYFRQF